MNLEQIAQEVADELFLGGKAVGHEPAKFLRRCLSKLAEQDVEPVAWMDKYGVLWAGVVDGSALKYQALYTEAQLIAAQQRTAEACAKVCDDIADEAWSKGEVQFADRCAAAIRNGHWREYL